MLALLHGRVADAWHLNALLVMLLPMALTFAAACYWRAVKASEFAWPKIPAAAMYGLLAAGSLFGVLRNLA